MKYYNSIAEGYDELYREEQTKKIELIKKYLKVKKSDYLLDVGTGTGIALEFFDCRKIGIDPSKELLKKAKVPVICSKAEKIPFKDKTFDVAISVTAIQNFDDIEKGLKEIKRVCKGAVALTFLKKSKKRDEIVELINKYFKIDKEIEEEKDLIFIGRV